MNEERLDSLESRLLFQDDVIGKLDEALASQQQQIMELERMVKLLNDQLTQFETQQLPEGPEPPPPHY